MKKYCLNKNFIPKEFVENKKDIIYKKNKRSLMLLGILVLLLLPHSITFIFHNFFYNEKSYKSDKEITSNCNYNDESFYKWMDIIKDETVGTFNNGNATIYIDGMDKLKDLLKNKDIIVTNVEDLGDRNFKIQIRQV